MDRLTLTRQVGIELGILLGKYRVEMHENVIVLVSLRDGVEEGRRFLKEEKYPMTSKELNAEPYEVKISCTVL